MACRRAAVQTAAILAPARFTTASTPASRLGSRRPAAGSQKTSSDPAAGRLTSRSTSWPAPARYVARLAPISPLAPLMATLRRARSRHCACRCRSPRVRAWRKAKMRSKRESTPPANMLSLNPPPGRRYSTWSTSSLSASPWGTKRCVCSQVRNGPCTWRSTSCRPGTTAERSVTQRPPAGPTP